MERLTEAYKPKYLQLVDIIRRDILSGKLKEGDKLLSENEMKQTAALIMRVLQNIDDEKEINEVKAEVAELCSGFPLPGISK